MTALFPLSKAAQQTFLENLGKGLACANEKALANVTHDAEGRSLFSEEGNIIEGRTPKGGPFGAALAVVLEDGSMIWIGEPCGNNVLASGIASFHAEHEVLSAENYARLVAVLTAAKGKAGLPTVILFSSAQSCTTCHTKQEIVARDLLRHGLIERGHFLTIYGATYDETRDIARFNDKIYADAMIGACKKPDDPLALIKHKNVSFAALTPALQSFFSQAQTPVAAIVREDKLYATGIEARTAEDLFSTAEVMALRDACQRYRQEGHSESWTVDGTLYTTTQEIGPLLYAESGWTRVSKIVSVIMPPELAAKQFQTQEACDVSNKAFFSIVAGGYKHPDRAIHVYRDSSFQNIAMPLWAKLVAEDRAALYNGAALSCEPKKTYALTDERFTAPDMTEIF